VARDLLEESAQLAADHRPGLAITTEHLHGHVVQELREASTRGSELVVGQRGLNRFAELMLGSTGLAVAGHTETPVVVVRGEAVAPRGEVVVGTDLGDEMSRPLKYAFEAARSRGASLRVLHAWDATAGVRAVVKGYADPLDRLEEQLAPFRELFPEVKATEMMVYDHVLSALIEASCSADLLVVGSRGRRALAGTLLGSTGHGMLHHSHCPVAIITPH
jgi:nucleotide-binding universal stress UspA family protein